VLLLLFAEVDAHFSTDDELAGLERTAMVLPGKGTSLSVSDGRQQRP
jgi:hypothetical protein